ncbi:hypothetical protein [Peptoniphilus asaccharolyticus]
MLEMEIKYDAGRTVENWLLSFNGVTDYKRNDEIVGTDVHLYRRDLLSKTIAIDKAKEEKVRILKPKEEIEALQLIEPNKIYIVKLINPYLKKWNMNNKSGVTLYADDIEVFNEDTIKKDSNTTN